MHPPRFTLSSPQPLPRRTFLALLAGAGAWTLCGGLRAFAAVAEVDYYTCAMHPFVHLHDPKAKCPVCGMDLVPVYKIDKNTGAAPAAAATSFVVAPERLQQIGVTYETVAQKPLRLDLAAPATVMIDEANRRDINVKAGGGIVLHLFAVDEGQAVKKGDPLMTVLSEGWIAAQIDYVRAYRSLRRTAGTSANNNSILLYNQVEALRKRIRVWDLDENQIKELEAFALQISDVDLQSGKGLSGTFQLRSPMDGFVYKKNAVEGMKFESGQSLLELIDLSTVWIEAAFAENQVAWLNPGQDVALAFPALGGKSVTAPVKLIRSRLTEATHRLGVRIDIANPGGVLRPGMFGTATVHADLGNKLVVSEGAVLPTGGRNVAFVDQGGGRLEPRFIEIGVRAGNECEVLSGLAEGERVVASANFLVDSESRIQGALKTWGASK